MAGRREEQGEVGSRPAARAQYPEQAAPYCTLIEVMERLAAGSLVRSSISSFSATL